ncbi:hypothetical protein [Pseudomonas sp.]|uniref:hypothetical protein n=1 Tax=Pseudomonas sp. TaxID=306 RepID=UPI002914A97A|nr:hypothetical protein [Pseudomonas sp.]MDU4254531.1 hypothetical protein [Pseudomonas sp.]
MSTRRAISTDAVSASMEASVTYQVSLAPDVIHAVRTSIERSGMSGPKWVEAALERLKRESDEELHNLLSDPKPASRIGKSNLPFRVYPATLTAFKRLAKDYDSTIQVVLSHAFFMQSLAAFELPNTRTGS